MEIKQNMVGVLQGAKLAPCSIYAYVIAAHFQVTPYIHLGRIHPSKWRHGPPGPPVPTPLPLHHVLNWQGFLNWYEYVLRETCCRLLRLYVMVAGDEWQAILVISLYIRQLRPPHVLLAHSNIDRQCRVCCEGDWTGLQPLWRITGSTQCIMENRLKTLEFRYRFITSNRLSDWADSALL